jgi:hypothetical protein
VVVRPISVGVAHNIGDIHVQDYIHHRCLVVPAGDDPAGQSPLSARYGLQLCGDTERQDVVWLPLMLRKEDCVVGNRIKWQSPDDTNLPPAYGTIIGIADTGEILVEWDDGEDCSTYVYNTATTVDLAE